jgi:hypothetical protein
MVGLAQASPDPPFTLLIAGSEKVSLVDSYKREIASSPEE